jgi:DNA-binding MarR family transcriptional regulator
MKPINRVLSRTYSEDEILGVANTEEELRLRLEKAAAELEIVANRLRSAKTNGRDEAEAAKTPVMLAKRIAKGRMQAAQVLDTQSLAFGPVLDILLDLFISESDGRSISVTDAVVASRCSATTGLRWVHALEEARLVQKSDDVTDRRRTFLSLTPQGRELVVGCVEAYAAS